MRNTIEKTEKIKTLLGQLKVFCNTVNEILNNTSSAEHARYSSYISMAQTYNDLVLQAQKFLKDNTIFYTFNVDAMPNMGDTLWPAQKMILEQVLVSSRILLASLESSVNFVNDEFDNIENFLQSRLRAVVFKKPEKEIEIQNALESLLQGRGLSKGVDYDRESGKFEFSGREYIPDFVFLKMSLCIDVKLLKEGKKSRVIEEIGADITAYKKMYNRQLFVVYDLGEIRDEVEFKRDIEKVDGVKVIVVKH